MRNLLRRAEALILEYEAPYREWQQTLFPVLVEKAQAEQARQIAAKYLQS